MRASIRRCLSVYQRLVDRWAATPLYATILTALIVFTGGYGSLFSGEIRSAFPFYFGDGGWGSISWLAVGFWSLLALVAMLFFSRETAENRRQQRLIEETQKLERLVRTLPPEDFLKDFAELFRTADRAMILALDPQGPGGRRENLLQGARQIMQNMAILAKSFGRRIRSPDAHYAANVMRFRPTPTLTVDDQRELEQRLRFCEDGVHCSGLQGVLDLVLPLSTKGNDEKLEPDNDLRTLALPIPVLPKNGEKYKVLPGAPLAFVERVASCYADARELHKWCGEKGDFSESVRDKIREYFQGAEHIGSFLSVPLVDQEECPYGVLNVHANLPNLLGDGTSHTGLNSPLGQFVAITEPLVAMLVKLLSELDRIGETGDEVDPSLRHE